MTAQDTARAILVHGAWHRGSSWEPVAARLRTRGLTVTTPDLPSDVPGIGHEDLVAAVLAAAGDGGERVVLAAHSLGGLVAAVAAQRLGAARVRALVLVGALVPEPGRSYLDRLRAERDLMVPGYDAGVVRGEGVITFWPDPDTATAGLYRGVAEELEAAGASRGEASRSVATAVAQMRPQDWTVLKEPSPLVAWPGVRTLSVICADDRVVAPEGARRDAARIGAEIVELPGGHFPMLTRPAQPAELLASVAGGSPAR